MDGPGLQRPCYDTTYNDNYDEPIYGNDPNYDPATVDIPGATLLGERRMPQVLPGNCNVVVVETIGPQSQTKEGAGQQILLRIPNGLLDEFGVRVPCEAGIMDDVGR